MYSDVLGMLSEAQFLTNSVIGPRTVWRETAGPKLWNVEVCWEVSSDEWTKNNKPKQ